VAIARHRDRRDGWAGGGRARRARLRGGAGRGRARALGGARGRRRTAATDEGHSGQRGQRGERASPAGRRIGHEGVSEAGELLHSLCHSGPRAVMPGSGFARHRCRIVPSPRAQRWGSFPDRFGDMAGFAIVHILIVGGAGVLGSAITPHLRSSGHRVTTLGPDPAGRTEDHVVADATDFEALADAFDGVDAVVNFALRTPRGPGADERTEPVRAGFAVNVGSVYTQLRCAARAQVPAFVQISTMAVLEGYGQRRRSALAETDNTTFYGLTKRMAETACEAEAARSPRLTVTTLRLAYATRDAWGPQW